ncbi:hypothetical protein BpHYR1_017562 [Brachionus plicatilis]|uniref:Uncharacterized protein n=1 Tax=Brachionus plicatilis TaxID=10195 RepID=A0A3M7QRN5_BRAPC|nr:hypothetical protein BpHYR1_017562 [Brachionus plicatilis]
MKFIPSFHSKGCLFEYRIYFTVLHQMHIKPEESFIFRLKLKYRSSTVVYFGPLLFISKAIPQQHDHLVEFILNIYHLDLSKKTHYLTWTEDF